MLQGRSLGVLGAKTWAYAQATTYAEYCQRIRRQAKAGRQADRQTDSLHTCTFDIPDLQSTVKHATPNEAPIMVVGTGSHSDSARLG